MPDWSAWPFPTEDPYPAYHAARTKSPVQWCEPVGAHLVLSHEHAASVLRGPAWSSDPRNGPQLAPDPATELLSRSLLMSDPPAHTRLRTAVNRFFTPRAVRRIRDRVAAIVDSAIAPLRDGAPVEVMSELAYPIPLAVIAELFDVGLEGAELLRSETPTLAKLLELDPTPEQMAEINAAAMTIMLFLVPLVAQRRLEPGDDLLSALIHSADRPTALETDEIVTMCVLLLAAGHETTANLIGNGVLALLQNPSELHWLTEHPEGTAGAVEELLRYDSPAQVASRFALEDIVLGGVAVRQGEQALVLLGAANRDPAVHTEPDRLSFARDPARHLAFGNGPHFCLGAGLARLEAQETFLRLAGSSFGPGPDGVAYRRDRSRTFRRLTSLIIQSGAGFRQASKRSEAIASS